MMKVKGTREWRIGHFDAVQMDDEGVVWVTRQSLISGQVATMPIHGYHGQTVAQWLTARLCGGRPAMIQDAFPNLTNDEREFILTGITPQEWKDSMGDEDDNG